MLSKAILSFLGVAENKSSIIVVLPQISCFNHYDIWQTNRSAQSFLAVHHFVSSYFKDYFSPWLFFRFGSPVVIFPPTQVHFFLVNQHWIFNIVWWLNRFKQKTSLKTGIYLTIFSFLEFFSFLRIMAGHSKYKFFFFRLIFLMMLITGQSKDTFFFIFIWHINVRLKCISFSFLFIFLAENNTSIKILLLSTFPSNSNWKMITGQSKCMTCTLATPILVEGDCRSIKMWLIVLNKSFNENKKKMLRLFFTINLIIYHSEPVIFTVTLGNSHQYLT